MAFPSTPTDGQLTTINGINYVYSSANKTWTRTLAFAGNLSTSVQYVVSNTNTSISTTTGAIVTAGGVGITGNIYTGGNIVANTANTTTTVANLVTSNGVYWANGAPYSSGSGGAVATGGIFFNSNVITANTVIPAGQNGFSVGPITQSAGVTVTIAPGQRWVIV